MNRLKYIWIFYLRPILWGIDPNSEEGLALRVRKLKEDAKNE